MAKSLRSKRKRMLRRQRREKYKVKEKERLLQTLGISGSDKDTEMAGNSGVKDQYIDNNTDKEEQKHVQQNSNEDIEMDQDDAKQKKSGKIRVDRKQLLKRLGKKKHIKKKNKICKW
ncbi:uncharacterized protein LOC110254070 [Exaiptasia diaphana]|uniref:Uncharacterized protein n=1 Tax=Exaiptasia diaphana TaxID=2652724 RepID=A0A913YA82_EXADI|nr:uncharacterized protein LOC110254070 [Exaiptasia diaphana]KXJ21492.1 hypothetical protein AC249_AIPGENE803 [Exaiptasia diaphana]